MTRGGVRPAEVAVVIDVLRATSTATQALAAGYRRVLFAESVERARSLRGDGRVLAGEVGCLKPHGFDQGNSPLEATHRRGEELVLATTNGAPTVIAAAAAGARSVLLACLLNLESVVAALGERADPAGSELLLLCSGTDGELALEDMYVAGRLSASLPGPRTDAARVAEAVARAFRTPFDALEASADAAVLRARNLTADVAHCALESELDCVPEVRAAGAGVAIVVESGDRVRDLSVRTAVDGGDTVKP